MTGPAIAWAIAACTTATPQPTERAEVPAHDPGGEAVGGCRYTRTEGTCTLASIEEIDANSHDPSLAGLRLVYEWVGELPPQFHDERKFVDWTVPRSRLDAARAHAAERGTVACHYALSTGGCPPDLQIEPAEVPKPP